MGEGFRKDRNPGGRSRQGVCICEIYVMETIIKRNQEKIKMETIKINKLEIENVKRVKAVRVEPTDRKSVV